MQMLQFVWLLQELEELEEQRQQDKANALAIKQLDDEMRKAQAEAADERYKVGQNIFLLYSGSTIHVHAAAWTPDKVAQSFGCLLRCVCPDWLQQLKADVRVFKK